VFTIENAIALAARAHAGQKDKSERPYVLHVLRVMLAVPDDAKIAAVLHDIVEDTETTLEDLRALGVTAEDLEAIDLVTYKKTESRDVYYARIRMNPRALAVKLADIADNANPERLARLDAETRARLKEKYEKARSQLIA
jgi:(p)ppGpp synthase/HD superfamily hydrolase